MSSGAFQTPIGILQAVWERNALISLSLTRKGSGTDRFPELERWISAYFSGKHPLRDFPLKPIGTPFQQTVWRHLLGIPYGETRSYGEIAKRIAEEKGIPKMSAQAVGNAIGKNPILILIPCHRVIRSDGNIGGFACGIDVKEKLLQTEHIHLLKNQGASI